MFDVIKRVCQNISLLDRDRILMEIFDKPDIQEFVIRLQKTQMYDEGIDSKGITLGDYSEASVKIFGKRPGHIQVYDTGQFYESIKIKNEPDQKIIEANTIKVAWDGAVDLLDRWANLLGLTENSLSQLREYVKPIFIEIVRKNILA